MAILSFTRLGAADISDLGGASWGIRSRNFWKEIHASRSIPMPRISFEFTGAEDYFDAAWWFNTGMFTVAFAGFTDFIDAFYRFHYMDCYEFTKSFDFDMHRAMPAIFTIISVP